MAISNRRSYWPRGPIANPDPPDPPDPPVPAVPGWATESDGDWLTELGDRWILED